LWVRAVEILLLLLLIAGALYSQGYLKVAIPIVPPPVSVTPTPTATTQHR